jgi:mono/diheme cytochrome c family protein
MRIHGGTMKPLEGMMLGLPLLAATLAIGAAVAVGQTDSPQQQANDKMSAKPASASKPASPGKNDHGQQVFEQNCARCHHAPDDIPSSISGTVAMHMRVRARLSEADYKALRQFLNP